MFSKRQGNSFFPAFCVFLSISFAQNIFFPLDSALRNGFYIHPNQPQHAADFEWNALRFQTIENQALGSLKINDFQLQTDSTFSSFLNWRQGDYGLREISIGLKTQSEARQIKLLGFGQTFPGPYSNLGPSAESPSEQALQNYFFNIRDSKRQYSTIDLSFALCKQEAGLPLWQSHFPFQSQIFMEGIRWQYAKNQNTFLLQVISNFEKLRIGEYRVESRQSALQIHSERQLNFGKLSASFQLQQYDSEDDGHDAEIKKEISLAFASKLANWDYKLGLKNGNKLLPDLEFGRDFNNWQLRLAQRAHFVQKSSPFEQMAVRSSGLLLGYRAALFSTETEFLYIQDSTKYAAIHATTHFDWRGIQFRALAFAADTEQNLVRDYFNFHVEYARPIKNFRWVPFVQLDYSYLSPSTQLPKILHYDTQYPEWSSGSLFLVQFELGVEISSFRLSYHYQSPLGDYDTFSMDFDPISKMAFLKVYWQFEN